MLCPFWTVFRNTLDKSSIGQTAAGVKHVERENFFFSLQMFMDCQQSVHFCVQGSTEGGQTVEPEDESCQSGRKREPPCCARTKWQTNEPQKSNIWSSWCGVLRKRLFLLYSVQCTLQRGHLMAKRFALKVVGMRMLISSLNNECKKSCCLLLQLLMKYSWP